jgi:hypothetical protein
MRICPPAVSFVVLSILVLGCSQKAPPPAVDLAELTKPKAPTLDSELDKIAADSSQSDQQALEKMGQVLTQRTAEFNLLDAMPEGVQLEENDGSWNIELKLWDVAAPIGLASPEQAARAIAKTSKLTKTMLASELASLLQAGGKRHLTTVRASVYTHNKKQAAEAEPFLAYRVLANVADAQKIESWWLGPPLTYPRQPPDEAARNKLESEMWTVEVDEYPNLHIK